MVEINISTLMISIQALSKQIEYFEGLLSSETVRDKGEIQELLLSFDNAAENLKEAYQEKRVNSSNYPEYEQLIKNLENYTV